MHLDNCRVHLSRVPDSICGNAWDLFFQIDKISRVLDKPWIPEPGSSGA
jgi:hypothetical protein